MNKKRRTFYVFDLPEEHKLSRKDLLSTLAIRTSGSGSERAPTEHNKTQQGQMIPACVNYSEWGPTSSITIDRLPLFLTIFATDCMDEEQAELYHKQQHPFAFHQTRWET
ncbi:hypothetical protein MJO28_003786 [Puccinia striiformis f. sp. tritici]|uniref:Uncharacterized protein n=1 Tax=Puccinia striiformis f. sp. tritici TaxID=168172 RepID=A0ACC0EMR0_9BASI|nr:hypothetical protein MJO28_003786 [Puccinia striiformis f. sp. tritici]